MTGSGTMWDSRCVFILIPVAWMAAEKLLIYISLPTISIHGLHLGWVCKSDLRVELLSCKEHHFFKLDEINFPRWVNLLLSNEVLKKGKELMAKSGLGLAPFHTINKKKKGAQCIWYQNKLENKKIIRCPFCVCRTNVTNSAHRYWNIFELSITRNNVHL